MMLTPAEAEFTIGQHLTGLPIESLPLTQAVGAILRENIYAERDAPPFDRVAMDGIALRAASVARGVREFAVQGMQAAGAAPLTLESDSNCIEIMTGAMLPQGCDAVVPIEQISMSNGAAQLQANARVDAYLNVHRRGSDSRQGALLLASGARLAAPDIAVAASAGMARVRVSAQPAIVVISTGDELVEPGEAIRPYQVRRSNVYGVVAALKARGFTRVADDHVQDDAAAIEARLKQHLATHDTVILSGGVSMGKLDLIPQVLQRLGVRQIFHKIAQRPGKPMWFGVAPSGTTVFALPGNPVSTLVCLARYVVPALDRAMAVAAKAPERLALGKAVTVNHSLTFFLPVKLQTDEWGRTWANPSPTNGSGDFTALAGTEGFVELPAGAAELAKGFVATLYRW
ncbi:MAG TPA: molybdopterin molybdotransferase MoeA [Steroidobacteraceae bacterium]|nr:molybdopterin molybdotransferase MoeA [Steroidobacteraceae bacterium]HRX89791.1 molybdopterin molybdotransferase MoeA [Steroidobacteraceae bacterium]